MAPPSEKTIISTLRTCTARLYKEDRKNLTVNIVRNVVEFELGLPEGQLKGEGWKDRSKRVVLEKVAELDAIDTSSAKKVKPAAKPPAKRKFVPSPEKDIELGDEGTADDVDEEDEEEQPRKKVKPSPGKKKTPVKKAAPKKKLVQRKKAVTPSDDDEEMSGLGDGEESEVSFNDSDSDAPKKKSPARKGKNVVESEDEESELSTAESEEEASKKKKDVKKAAPKKKSVMSDDEEDELSSVPSDKDEDTEESEVEMPNKRQGVATKAKAEPKGKKIADSTKRLSATQVVDSDDEDEDEDVKAKSPKKSGKKVESHDDDKEEDTKTKSPFKSPKKKTEVGDDESEMSDVRDEPPVKKGRGKSVTTTKSATTTKSKSATKSKAAAKPTDPKAEELKTLTQQLGKCGVRKVWGAYLKKQFGDDHKKKVGHLKEMLRDVGMEGRFSEHRAKEIKEKRELEGDLEVLRETARKWGADKDPFGTGGRPSRRTAASRRSLKEVELSEEASEEKVEDEDAHDDSDAESASGGGSSDDDEGSGQEGSDEDVKPKGVKRARNAKRDEGLAFLSSESESE